jgi:hypothetical protein
MEKGHLGSESNGESMEDAGALGPSNAPAAEGGHTERI